jgi:hypothetical protein
MCRINNNCKVDVELFQEYRTEPIAKWNKIKNKEDIFVMGIHDALHKLMIQALEQCDEIRIPTILVNHETPQDKYADYDNQGIGIGEPIGTVGEFRLGFYMYTLGTKKKEIANEKIKSG